MTGLAEHMSNNAENLRRQNKQLTNDLAKAKEQNRNLIAKLREKDDHITALDEEINELLHADKNCS